MGLLASIAGGLLGIGSSSIQNSQNRQNVRETNQMNYKINQMNNQFNERMAMQQRDFQENMWNKENAYNTASAQRQRLEEAGLNRYLMMNGGSAGVAQSAGPGASASSAGAASVATAPPFSAIWLRTRARLVIGDCKLPSNLERSSSLDGTAATAFMPASS